MPRESRLTPIRAIRHTKRQLLAVLRMHDAQPDLFTSAEQAQRFVGRGDPDRVRARLAKIMAEARAASSVPWSRNDEGMYEIIVPQMTKWLPPDEAARWCREFADELARLRAGRG